MPVSDSDIAFGNSLCSAFNVHQLAVDGHLQNSEFCEYLALLASCSDGALLPKARSTIAALVDAKVGPALRRAAEQVGFCSVILDQELLAASCMP